MHTSRCSWLATSLLVVAGLPALARAQQVSIDTSAAGRQQIIDGFGTCLSGDEGQQPWFQMLYFAELQSSLLRFDITPAFKSPYSAHHYSSRPGTPTPRPSPGPRATTFAPTRTPRATSSRGAGSSRRSQ
jgi:hypothetical protein